MVNENQKAPIRYGAIALIFLIFNVMLLIVYFQTTKAFPVIEEAGHAVGVLVESLPVCY